MHWGVLRVPSYNICIWRLEEAHSAPIQRIEVRGISHKGRER